MAQPELISLDEAKARVATKTRPRVTEEAIKAKIARTVFLTEGTLTLCILEMTNGFKVVGKAAPASPENYDSLIGQRYAYEDAFKQLWHFEGYLLCERLAFEGAMKGA